MILTFLKGLLMGSADIVPGVSGGTMAFITGIYDDLIGSLAKVSHAIKKGLEGKLSVAWNEINWRLFLPLGLGIAIAFGIGSAIIPRMMEAFPGHVYGFFSGLVLASAYIVYRHITRHDLLGVLWGLWGLSIGLLVALTPAVQVPFTALSAFLFGMLAVSAMLLPGISGSYILLIFGQYEHVLDALHRLDWRIGLFVAGMGTGLLVFSRLLSHLLKKHHAQTFWWLLGLMLGSLAGPVSIATSNGTWLSLLLAVIGAALVVGIERLAHR